MLNIEFKHKPILVQLNIQEKIIKDNLQIRIEQLKP